jgi:hypothetical protein
VTRLFSSAEVARIAGCTYRQLDHWVRAGHVRPTQAAQGPGTRRVFDETGLLQAAVTAVAARAQIPPGALALDDLIAGGADALAPGLVLALDKPVFAAHIQNRIKEIQ